MTLPALVVTGCSNSDDLVSRLGKRRGPRRHRVREPQDRVMKAKARIHCARSIAAALARRTWRSVSQAPAASPSNGNSSRRSLQRQRPRADHTAAVGRAQPASPHPRSYVASNATSTSIALRRAVPAAASSSIGAVRGHRTTALACISATSRRPVIASSTTDRQWWQMQTYWSLGGLEAAKPYEFALLSQVVPQQPFQHPSLLLDLGGHHQRGEHLLKLRPPRRSEPRRGPSIRQKRINHPTDEFTKRAVERDRALVRSLLTELLGQRGCGTTLLIHNPWRRR